MPNCIGFSIAFFDQDENVSELAQAVFKTVIESVSEVVQSLESIDEAPQAVIVN